MEGFVKLQRKLIEWEWYTDANTTRVFLHCLLKANWKGGRFRGVVVPAGSFITSREHLAEELNMSEQSVRTALEHLKSTNEITIKSTNKWTLITVEKWAVYQCEDISINQPINQQLTNNQPTTNQQLTTIEERKNVIKKEDCYSNKPQERPKDWKPYAVLVEEERLRKKGMIP